MRRIAALVLLACGPAAAAPPPATVTVWLYAPTADNATWAGWYADVAAHRANVTGVAPCSYLVGSDGVWTTQFPNASVAAMARGWTARFTNELRLQVSPLLAASGTGMNAAIANATLGDALIAASVAEARALGLTGFNLQLEEPGSAVIQAQWTAFLLRWLSALGPNVTLSVIIGGVCRARDWMWMDCGNYRQLAANASAVPYGNLRLISEATYEGEPSAWKAYLADLVRGVSAPLLQLGMEVDKPTLTNPLNGCLPAAVSAGVRDLYVWVNTPGAGAGGQAAWDAFGWWLTAGAGRDGSAAPP